MEHSLSDLLRGNTCPFLLRLRWCEENFSLLLGRKNKLSGPSILPSKQRRVFIWQVILGEREHVCPALVGSPPWGANWSQMQRRALPLWGRALWFPPTLGSLTEDKVSLVLYFTFIASKAGILIPLWLPCLISRLVPKWRGEWRSYLVLSLNPSGITMWQKL